MHPKTSQVPFHDHLDRLKFDVVVVVTKKMEAMIVVVATVANSNLLTKSIVNYCDAGGGNGDQISSIL